MDQVLSAEANDFDKPGESHVDVGISRQDHESGTTEIFRVQDYLKLTFDSDRICGFSAKIIEAFETPSDRDMTFTYMWRCHLARGNKKELILKLMLYAEQQVKTGKEKWAAVFNPYRSS
eukprot:IDg1349t1